MTKVTTKVDIQSDEYLSNPTLYSIGINRDCFSKKLFGMWIFYALWHALVVFYVVLYCLN